VRCSDSCLLADNQRDTGSTRPVFGRKNSLGLGIQLDGLRLAAIAADRLGKTLHEPPGPWSVPAVQFAGQFHGLFECGFGLFVALLFQTQLAQVVEIDQLLYVRHPRIRSSDLSSASRYGRIASSKRSSRWYM
jgi:hypothetical protein